jgi:flagellar motor switch protein FliN/FliY
MEEIHMAEQDLRSVMEQVKSAAGDVGAETPTGGGVQGSGAGGAPSSVVARAVQFGPLADSAPAGGGGVNLQHLMDLPVTVQVEIGHTRLRLEDVLNLAPGSVVSLDRRAGEPVDLCVNGKLLARGEVVMVDECYGLRIIEIVDIAGRMEAMT